MADNMPQPRWESRDAWEALPLAEIVFRGIKLCPTPPRALIHLAVAPADREKFATGVAELFATLLPKRPCRIAKADLALAWAGLDQWFLTYRGRELASIEKAFGALATLTDLSASRATLRVSGENARKLLAKTCPIDLHPGVFKPGDVAITSFGHIGVHLAQIDDVPSYELAVFRSMAKSFHSCLTAAAQQFR